MGYDSTIFLKPYNSEDKNLLLYDDSGVLKYTINPFSISNVQIRGNIITISIKNGRTILLDFLNNNYASNALPLLQDRIKLLTREKSVHIDKQIQNWVENIDLITTTLSISGNIIPSEDYTWNLGSTTSRWNNIYVKDAIVASQSLYIGDLKVSTVENEKTGEPALVIGDKTTTNYIEIAPDGLGGVLIGDTNLDLYNGAVIGEFETPSKGQVITLTIPPFQSWKEGDNAKFFNSEVNDYVDEGYSDDDIHSFFIGRVQTYDSVTGEITVVVDDSYNSGLTFSELTFKLNTDNPKVTNIVQAIDGDVIPDAGLTYNLGTSEKSWNNLYIGDLEVSVVDSNLSINGVKIATYNGVSEDLLTIPSVGGAISINTTTGLDLRRGDTVNVYNDFQNEYNDEGYSEDDIYLSVFGIVDSYDRVTGEMTVISQDSYGIGETFSNAQVAVANGPMSNRIVIEVGTVTKAGSIIIYGGTESSAVVLATGGRKVRSNTGPTTQTVITPKVTTLLDEETDIIIKDSEVVIGDGKSAGLVSLSGGTSSGEILLINARGGRKVRSNTRLATQAVITTSGTESSVELAIGDDYFAGQLSLYGGTTSLPEVLLSGEYGIGTSPTFSFFKIDSNAVLLNKVYFGATSANQSIYVSEGNLYVNGVTFSGGAGSQGPFGSTGPQGAEGAQGPQGADGPQGTNGNLNYGTFSISGIGTSIRIDHNFGRYPIIQVLDLNSASNMLVPHDGENYKVEYQVDMNSFTFTWGGTPSSAYVIYMA